MEISTEQDMHTAVASQAVKGEIEVGDGGF